MTDIKHLHAMNSLLDLLKLNETEIEELYQLMGDINIEIFMQELQYCGESIPTDADEFALLEWLKNLNQKSPKTYEVLQKLIRENQQLFDKIQEIFIEKLL